MMNQRTDAILTQMSDCSTSSVPSLYQKIYILQTQNLEFKRRWESCNMLNLTLKQALLNISKKSKIDPDIMQKLQSLSAESSNPSSPQTLGQLRQFYQQQIRIKEFKNNKVIEQLKSIHQQQIRIMKQKLDREYKERISKDRQHILKQVQSYIDKKQIKAPTPKLVKQTLENPIKRRKSFSECITKSVLSNSFTNNERSSLRSDSKSNLEVEQNIKYSARTGKVATELKCSNCNRIFSPNEFVNHINVCRTLVEYHSERSSEQKKNELMNQLLRRKREIENELSQYAQYNEKVQSKEVLETDLDQIVYVINNKNHVSSENIERVLKRVIKRLR